MQNWERFPGGQSQVGRNIEEYDTAKTDKKSGSSQGKDNEAAEEVVPLPKRLEVMKERFEKMFNNGYKCRLSDFYKHFGWSSGKIHAWQAGRVTNPKDSDARRLADELNMNFQYIRSGRGNPFEKDQSKLGYDNREKAGQERGREQKVAEEDELMQNTPTLQKARILLASETKHKEILINNIDMIFESYIRHVG